jgi:hypothetical protein
MPSAIALLFPPFFIAMWLGVGAALAEISGWPALARRFRTEQGPPGRRLRRQVVMLGPTHESGVTRIITSSAGLYLDASPLFRFRRPPLLLPWSAVRHRSERRLLWLRWHEIDLAGITILGVKPRAYEAIAPFLSTAITQPRPNEAVGKGSV